MARRNESAIQDIIAEAFEDAIGTVPLPLDVPHQNGGTDGREHDARGGSPGKPKEYRPIPFLRASQWNGVTVPPKRWLVQDRIPMRQVALLSGAGAIGKTTIALQLAVAVAAGLNDWLGGIVNEPGPVMFFTAEEENDDVQHRLNAVVTHHRIELPDNLHVYCVNDEDSVAGDSSILAMADRRGVMQPTETYWRLRKAIDEVRPKLIIIESASDVFGGDEINRQQVRAFVRMLKAIAMHYDCVVLLLSHPSAAGSVTVPASRFHTMAQRPALPHVFQDGEGRRPGRGRGPHRPPRARNQEAQPGAARASASSLLWKDGVFAHEASLNPLQRYASDATVDDLFLKLLRRYHDSGRNVVRRQVRRSRPRSCQRA
jgi:hypothetical protein